MFLQQNSCRIYIFSSEINNNKSLEYYRTVEIYTRSCCPLVLSVRSIPTAPLFGSPTSTKRVLHMRQRTDKVNEQSHVVLMDTDNESQERCCPGTCVCFFEFQLTLHRLVTAILLVLHLSRGSNCVPPRSHSPEVHSNSYRTTRSCITT